MAYAQERDERDDDRRAGISLPRRLVRIMRILPLLWHERAGCRQGTSRGTCSAKAGLTRGSKRSFSHRRTAAVPWRGRSIRPTIVASRLTISRSRSAATTKTSLRRPAPRCSLQRCANLCEGRAKTSPQRGTPRSRLFTAASPKIQGPAEMSSAARESLSSARTRKRNGPDRTRH